MNPVAGNRHWRALLPGCCLQLRDRFGITVDRCLQPYDSDAVIQVYADGPREYVSRTVLSADELASVPGSFGDPIRALQNLPGVARPAGPQGDIVVRGAEAINTGAYIDGMPVPFLFHMFVGRSVVNPAVLEDVEFFPGGMPSDFGDVTQAVVNARTYYEPPKRGLHGRVNVDLLDGGFGLTAKQGPWSLSAGARVSWMSAAIGIGSQIASGASRSPSYRSGWVSPYYSDFQVRGSRQIGDHRLALSFIGARDQLRITPERTDRDGDGRHDPPPVVDDLPYDPNTLLDSQFYLVEARLDGDLGIHDSTTRIVVGWDRQTSLFSEFGRLSQAPELGGVEQWTFIAERSDVVELSRAVTVRAGARVQLRPTTTESWRDATADRDAVTGKDNRLTAGLWSDAHLSLGRWWVAPGLRLNAHRYSSRTTILPEPRLTARYDANDHIELTGFVGRFSQTPPGHRTAPGIGNPDLPVMQAWQVSLGMNTRLGNSVTLDATVFGSYMPHLTVMERNISLAYTSGYSRDPVLTTVATNDYVDTRGAAAGLELLARLRPNGRWFGWAGLTISKSLRRGEGRWYPGDYDMPVSGVLVAARKLPRHWQLSGRFRMSSGQPYTPVVPVYASTTQQWSAYDDEVNSARLPLLHTLDLRVEKKWLAERATWTWYLDVANVYNRKNPFIPTFNSNYQRRTSEVFVPLIPTTGLQVDF